MDNSLNVTGQVLDAQTNTGVAGFNVEVWDQSLRFQSAMAVLTTDQHGRFNVVLDLAKLGLQTPPVLVFKVLKDNILYASTDNSVIWNTQTEDDVTIFIRTARPERPVGKDRVNSTQVLKSAAFVHQSDFKGVFQQAKTKASMPAGLFSDMLTNAFKNMNVAPIRVQNDPEAGLKNQDVAAATSSLQAKQIQVNQVLDYNPQLNKDTFKILKGTPVNLAAGQKVNLYQENGKVMYYSVVEEPAASTLPPANMATTDQIKGLQDQLALTQKDSVAKDAQIAQLNTQVAVFQKDHDQITASTGLVAQLQSELAASQQDAATKTTQITQLNTQVAAFQKDHDQIAASSALVTQLQTQLAASQQDAATKNTQITQLNTQMLALQQSHQQIASVINSAAFTKAIGAQQTITVQPVTGITLGGAQIKDIKGLQNPG
ncbi:MAG: hypothetical protein JWQ57_2572 [Mucilaginibacter sp.]|nr:hypothetical protein [Mucilaginibacter sp.]